MIRTKLLWTNDNSKGTHRYFDLKHGGCEKYNNPD